MPPAKMKIEIGMVFNFLTVFQKGEPSKAGHPQWGCLCICGKPTTKRQSQLIAGTTTSCGCMREGNRLPKITKHGWYGTPEYSAWSSMKKRCFNYADKNYQNYGGRGIKVCDRWLKFENFIADMGKRPSPEHSLERVNNDGNYEPSNCKWATRTEQGRNRRTCTMVELGGFTKSIAEWCDIFDADYEVVIQRMKRGKTLLESLKGVPCHETFERLPEYQMCQEITEIIRNRLVGELERSW